MDEKCGDFFFKVMVPGFHDELVLPSAFCGKLKEEKLEQAILTSRCGTTEVNVCRNQKGLILFKEGWKDFVDKNDLRVWDTIVFEHIGGLHFNAIIFDPTACAKQFPEQVNLDDHPKGAEKKANVDSGTSYNSGCPHFTIKMKPYNGRKGANVKIPTKFWKSTNLSKKTTAKLKDPCGKTWTVGLLFIKRENNGVRCLISKGWYNFYKSNKLKVGDTCIFQLHPHSRRSKTAVMDVQIMRAVH